MGVAAPRGMPLRGRARLQEVLAGYLFAAPAVSILTFFIALPIVYVAYLSLFDYDLLSPEKARWIGLGNYRAALDDPVFRIALRNVVFYTLGVVPTQVAIALVLALFLSWGVRGQSLFRISYFLPTVTSSVVVSFMFLYIYSNTGLLNWLLTRLGLPPHNWMQEVRLALPSIMAMNVWSTVGQLLVLSLAGLGEIPASLYEAALVDGAGTWQRLRYVTLPLLRPTLLFVVVVSTIGCMQVFDQMYLMTGGTGGPANATMTLVLYIWKNAFGGYFEVGYASALSFILFALILGLAIVQYRMLGKEVQY